jgi:hypothetical protein
MNFAIDKRASTTDDGFKGELNSNRDCPSSYWPGNDSAKALRCKIRLKTGVVVKSLSICNGKQRIVTRHMRRSPFCHVVIGRNK